MCQTDDLSQTEFLESKLQRGFCPFGRQALPSELPAQQITSLYLVRFRQILQSVPTDEFASKGRQPTSQDRIPSIA